jgi:hypothetical protein
MPERAVIGTSFSFTNSTSWPRIARTALHPRPDLGGFCQGVAELTPMEADVLQFPVTETSQHDKICLVLAMRDHGGNPAVDEAGKARQKNPEGSSKCGRGRRVARVTIQYRHGNFLRKTGAPRRLAVFVEGLASQGSDENRQK